MAAGAASTDALGRRAVGAGGEWVVDLHPARVRAECIGVLSADKLECEVSGVPQAWPQLLSACGYLLLFVVVTRRRIKDPQLRAWLWLLPVWFVLMFVYGILIETRVFGELIPFVVCATALIVEELLLADAEGGGDTGTGDGGTDGGCLIYVFCAGQRKLGGKGRNHEGAYLA